MAKKIYYSTYLTSNGTENIEPYEDTNKAKAIKQLIDGNVTPQCPASVLQFPTDVTLMLDKGAASLI